MGTVMFAGARRARGLVVVLALFTAPLVAAQSTSAPAAAERTIAVEAVGDISITVGDLSRSVAFFTDLLGFDKLSESPQSADELAAQLGLRTSASARSARLRLGDESIELVQFSPAGRPFPSDSRSNDRWFQHIAIVVNDMDKAYARLQQHDVKPASRGGPQTLPDWNKNAGGIRAYYFRDPDGHFLELIQFPPGKGDPRWQTSSKERLFLGIDHTAIVVADTEASLRFYRDKLGLRVAGGSENYGPEQEALNNVAGARLRITTLRAERGPGIELLQYLTPTDGRPYPTDASAADLISWRTTLRLARRGGSPSPTARDPDGHALALRDASGRE